MPGFWKNWKLSTKIAVTMTLVVTLTVFILATVFILDEQSILRNDLESEAGALLETISLAVDNELFALDVAALTTIAEQLTRSQAVTNLRFYDADGRLIVDTASEQVQLFTFDADPIGVQLVNQGTTSMELQPDKLVTSRPVFIGEQVVGAISMDLSTVRLNERLVESQIQGLLIGFIAIAVTTLLAFAISRTILQPVRNLITAALDIAQGHYDHRIQVTSTDEIGVLGQTFNSMAESVENREAALKQARQEALAAQRIANENSRLKSEFLSMMSHELRTPMNAIEGFTGIILKRMGGADYNDKTERYLHKIESNSHRLLNLINDFLDLSRIESGRLELANLPISPNEMAQKWHNNLLALAENKSLHFELHVDPNLPATIYGDEESISKIAVNLIGNAIKFTERGSVSVSLRKKDDFMELEVRDTGIGIPPHAREYIFDEFRQVDQSSKRKFGGTGLGLAIVQRLAREMRGNVSLHSEVGVGSTFTVTLPIQTEQVVKGVA